jgi:hypothetical protein
MPRLQGKSRREYLFAVGTAGLVSIAGCSSNNSSDESTPSDDRTQDDRDERSEPGGNTTDDVNNESETENPEPSFEIVSLNISDEIVMGSSASLKLKVSNTGNGSGNFTKDVQLTSKTVDYDEYMDTGGDIGGIVEPRETETFTQKIAGNNIGSFRLSIEDHDVEAETSVVARDLSLGEDYTNERGVEMSIDEITVQDSYEKDDGNTLRADGRFAFVKYTAENIGNETVNPSSSRSMNLRTEEGNYEPSLKGDTAANYDKIEFIQELEPGETLEGYIVYEPDYGAERQDMTVTWKGLIGKTEKRVNWRP